MYKILFFVICLVAQVCYGVHDSQAIAVAYYTAMAEKNMSKVADFLNPDVVFSAPLATMVGKENFLHRVEEFFACFLTLTIKKSVGCHDKAVLLFEVQYPAPINNVEFVAILHIKDGLIDQVELLYDESVFTSSEI